MTSVISVGFQRRPQDARADPRRPSAIECFPCGLNFDGITPTIGKSMRGSPRGNIQARASGNLRTRFSIKTEVYLRHLFAQLTALKLCIATGRQNDNSDEGAGVPIDSAASHCSRNRLPDRIAPCLLSRRYIAIKLLLQRRLL